jgi:hypothetical protein
MKTKSLKTMAAVAVVLFAIGITLHAQGTDTRISHPVMDGTAITKADAEKKYPPKSGTYPPGTRDAHDPSGVVSSPYPPYQKYNCLKINHGGLVLDVRAKQVFVYP